jgi:flagellar biosynthesis GTPase FlhF
MGIKVFWILSRLDLPSLNGFLWCSKETTRNKQVKSLLGSTAALRPGKPACPIVLETGNKVICSDTTQRRRRREITSRTKKGCEVENSIATKCVKIYEEAGHDDEGEDALMVQSEVVPVNKSANQEMEVQVEMDIFDFRWEEEEALEQLNEALKEQEAEENLAKEAEVRIAKEREAKIAKETEARIAMETEAKIAKETEDNLSKEKEAKAKLSMELKEAKAQLAKEEQTSANLVKELMAMIAVNEAAKMQEAKETPKDVETPESKPAPLLAQQEDEHCSDSCSFMGLQISGTFCQTKTGPDSGPFG